MATACSGSHARGSSSPTAVAKAKAEAEWPDGNDLELYWDRPASEWPLDENGRLAFVDGVLDLDDLLATV